MHPSQARFRRTALQTQTQTQCQTMASSTLFLASSKQSNGRAHQPSNSSSGLVRHSSPDVDPDNTFVNMCPHPFKRVTLCAINLVVTGGKGQFTRPADHKETTRKQKENQPDHEPEPQGPITTPTRPFAQNTWEISLSPRSTSDTQEVSSQS